MSKSFFSLMLTSIILKSYLVISGFLVMFLPKKEQLIIPKKSNQSESIKPEIMAKRVSEIKRSSANSIATASK